MDHFKKYLDEQNYLDFFRQTKNLNLNIYWTKKETSNLYI